MRRGTKFFVRSSRLVIAFDSAIRKFTRLRKARGTKACQYRQSGMVEGGERKLEEGGRWDAHTYWRELSMVSGVFRVPLLEPIIYVLADAGIGDWTKNEVSKPPKSYLGGPQERN